MRRIITITLLLIFAVSTYAGGFQVGLQGQRQTGMGLIGTGFLTGPSAVFYNPGGMTFLDGKYHFSFGVSPISSSVAFKYEAPSLYEATTDNPISYPFALYGSVKLNEKLAVGLGVYTPYGSSTVWGDDWQGRHIIQDISLQAIYIQPTISYKITEKLGIGVGFVCALGNVELNKGFPLQDSNGDEGQINIEGSGVSYGFNAGLYYEASDKLSFGLTYRSEVMMEVEGGDATFTVPSSLTTSFPTNNKFDADLPLPASLNFGTSYAFTEKLTVGLDVNYVFWSSYQSLDFDFEENTSSLEDISQPKKYDDGFIYRVGGEYRANEAWAFRLGFYYDSPVVSDDYYAPETPDAVKLGYTAGVSYYPTKKLSIDASFLFVQGLERDVTYQPENFGGTYKYSAYIPGIGINYQF